MRLYHGTTFAAAQDIQKYGLVPHSDHRFHLALDEFFGAYSLLEDYEPSGLIYLTPERGVAEAYAHFRAEYEPAQEGTVLTFYGGGHSEGLFTPVHFVKAGKSCRCKPTSAVVTFDIPSALYAQLEQDIQYSRGMVCTCVIPPQFIVAIEELTETTAEWQRKVNNEQDEVYSWR